MANELRDKDGHGRNETTILILHFTISSQECHYLNWKSKSDRLSCINPGPLVKCQLELEVKGVEYWSGICGTQSTSCEKYSHRCLQVTHLALLSRPVLKQTTLYRIIIIAENFAKGKISSISPVY